MNLSPHREYKLAGLTGDGRHAYVNENGAFIGLGVPLLEFDGHGKWRPRDRAVLERLFAKGYGVRVDLGRLVGQLRYVAQALNKNDLSLASISLVRAELPPLPSAERAWVMAKANGLILKYGPAWENEPRIPAQNTGGGEWTTNGGDGGTLVADGHGNTTGVIQVAGGQPCQGFGAGCQMGGTYGTSALYSIGGRNVCRDCAVKILGIGGLSGAEQAIILAPFAIGGK